MKYSKQCELVLNTVNVQKNHPTADAIYTVVKTEQPNISLATVYRNLNKLAENGNIAKIAFPNGGDRFDYNTEEHYHIICEGCNDIFDVKLKGFDSIDNTIKSQTGFFVTGHELIIKGLCKNCQNAE